MAKSTTNSKKNNFEKIITNLDTNSTSGYDNISICTLKIYGNLIWIFLNIVLVLI